MTKKHTVKRKKRKSFLNNENKCKKGHHQKNKKNSQSSRKCKGELESKHKAFTKFKTKG